MTKTFFGCSFSDIWVSPSNWKTISKSKAMHVNWYVQCDFHDPLQKKPFQYRKKLNSLKTYEERKAAVELYLIEIPKLFSELGYNPFTKSYMIEQTGNKEPEKPIFTELLPETPFLIAIDLALSKKKLSDRYLKDLKYTLEDFKSGILKLRLEEKPIGEIKRKDIKNVIEFLEVKKAFSAHKYNKYLDSLSTIFIELLEWEAVDANIIHGIKKRKKVKNIREVLTKEQRKKVVEHLKENHLEFHDFVQIFFHSGVRITELLTVKVSDVDLKNQYFKVLVKKDQNYIWKNGIIKNIALPFWSRLIFGAKKEDYIFSWGLVPGSLKLDYNAIRLRWTRNVQKPLNIKVGIYQLKHSNLDEVTELLSMSDAARLANHNNTKMLASVYAIGEEERKAQRLKKVANEL